MSRNRPALRRGLGVLAGGLALGVLVLALASILRSASELELAEQEARRLAAHEEKVRLALWRMDSALSTFLAYENAQPASPSPDHRVVDQPWVERRFTLEPADGDDGPSYAGVSADALGQIASTPMSFALVPRSRAATTTQPAASGLDPTGADPETEPTSAEPWHQLRQLDGVEVVDLTQQMSNVGEFNQRVNMSGQQSVFAGALTAEPPPRAPPPPPVVTGAGLLRPVWTRSEAGGPALLLVRKVVRDGDESLQGLELDFDATRTWLLGEIDDLLPLADVAPVTDPSSVDPGRLLALLPLRLDAGPVQPLADDPGLTSPARLGLTVAVAAIGLMVLAGAVVLVWGLHLARRRSDFAAAVIHELRTPLTTFRFYTEMLAEGMVAESDRQSYADTLRREADRLGHLVENVLAYARLETQGPPQRPAPGDGQPLTTFLEGVAERLRTRAREDDFELVWSADDVDDVLLAVEPLGVERILHNLCDNSCKYGRSDEARIELTLRADPETDRAVVHWRDFGPGLSRDASRGLFRAFHRDETIGTAGVGLGLALSRKLARRFGGDLRRVEVDGAGTAFELMLPTTWPS